MMRRVAMYRFVCLLAVFVALAAMTPRVRAEVLYSVTDLGTLGGSYSYANGINSSGQVVGFSHTTGNAAHHAFRYSGPTMTNLGTLGGTDSYAFGINDAGQVVGYSDTTGNAAFHAFRYSGTTMADLGTLGGTYSAALGINSSGQVVGWAYITGNGANHAFLYSEPLNNESTMIDLGTLGGSDSVANGINSSGQVVGYSNTTSGANHAFLYSESLNNESTMTDLGTLVGGTYSYAFGINDAGHVVGYYSTSSANHAFLYDGSTTTDLGTLGGTSSEAYGINSSGQVVGAATTTDNTAVHAFLYSESTMTDLNSLIDSGSGWVLGHAGGINDAGQIVGYGDISGQTHAFLLTPVPEPGTLSLLGILSVYLGGYAWRKRRRVPSEIRIPLCVQNIIVRLSSQGENSMKHFQSVLQLVCFVAIVAVTTSQAYCQSYWSGGAYGDYLSPDNWVVPTSNYAVIGITTIPSTNIYFSSSLTQSNWLEITCPSYSSSVLFDSKVAFDLRGNTLTLPSLSIGGYYQGAYGTTLELDVAGGTIAASIDTILYGAFRTLVVRDGGVLNTNTLNVYEGTSKVLVGPGGTMSFNAWGPMYSNVVEMDSGILFAPSALPGGYVRGNGVVVSSVPYSFSSVTGTTNLTQNLTVPAGQTAKVFSQGAAGLGPVTTLAPGSTLIAPAAGLILGQDKVLTASNATINGNIALQNGILEASYDTTVTGSLSGYGVIRGYFPGSIAAPSGTVSLDLQLNVTMSTPSTIYSQLPASLAGGLNLNNNGTLSAANGILLPGTATLAGSGTVNGKVTADANSTISPNGSLTLGDATSLTGFRTAGTLGVGSQTVNLLSRSFAQLGHTTLMGGGMLQATNGVSLGSGGNIVGSGTINARIAASTGSAIHADGNLALGNASSPVGFVSDGELYTYDNTVTLFDSNQAVLGSLTQIGDAINFTSGTLTAANGLLVDFGRNLVGQGTVNSTNSLAKATIINGDVEGNGTGLTLTGYVKGVGTFAGSVTFGGTYSPGLSPASVSLENMNLLSTSTLLVELAGTSPGSQFDVINLSGIGNLSGTLDVELLGGFTPQFGDSFDILNGATSGTFDNLLLPSLSGGLSWETSGLYSSGVISIVPEPGSLAMLLGLALTALLYVWRRRV